MRSSVVDQDYWPGFLDILVNVMLYLLLLVGSFALGAVALTLHSMQQRQQLSFLDGDKALAVDTLGLDNADRERLTRRLESLDVEAILQRREALGRERQMVEARRIEVERALALRQTQSRSIKQQKLNPSEAAEQDKAFQLAQLKQQSQDFENRLNALSQELVRSQDGLMQAKSELSANTQSRLSTVKQNIGEFRVGSASQVLKRAGSLGPLVEPMLQSTPVAIWEFSPDELVWPQSKVVPISGMGLDLQASWLLVIFADKANPRVVRESFARVSSVRNVLIGRGFDRQGIKVEVRPYDPAAATDERLYRSVFMFPNKN